MIIHDHRRRHVQHAGVTAVVASGCSVLAVVVVGRADRSDLLLPKMLQIVLHRRRRRETGLLGLHVLSGYLHFTFIVHHAAIFILAMPRCNCKEISFDRKTDASFVRMLIGTSRNFRFPCCSGSLEVYVSRYVFNPPHDSTTRGQQCEEGFEHSFHAGIHVIG